MRRFATHATHAPDTLDRTWDWRRRAACLGMDIDLFHPVGDTGPALAQLEEAKAVCRRCPVRGECLADVLRVESGWGATRREGIYGGLTSKERWELVRDRRRAAEGLAGRG
ncbi:WhiB family transcriptional regulator [Wenjunlia vitaminophila]|uniref:WhiB family transcriptional regulator n=1 Tax=Wenjunlia vitaminophila TaxID=76728 RepID=UPI00036C74D2|nr:WhiB family transcriptional regulator [Wenjunlia vitaminophila]